MQKLASSWTLPWHYGPLTLITLEKTDDPYRCKQSNNEINLTNQIQHLETLSVELLLLVVVCEQVEHWFPLLISYPYNPTIGLYGMDSLATFWPGLYRPRRPALADSAAHVKSTALCREIENQAITLDLRGFCKYNMSTWKEAERLRIR